MTGPPPRVSSVPSSLPSSDPSPLLPPCAREVTSNEYVIPLGPELKQLYEEPGMAHSLSVQTTMSVQPTMATLPVSDTSGEWPIGS